MIEYCVQVDEEIASGLDRLGEKEIKNALIETLEDLANADDEIQQQQDELHRRMGVSTDGDDEELTPEESAEAYREKLRRERRYGASETR